MGTAASKLSEEKDLASWRASVREKQEIFSLREPMHYREHLISICKLLKPHCTHCTKVDYLCSNPAEINILKKLIGTLKFGEPKGQASQANDWTGFDKDQMEDINIMFTELVRGLSGKGDEIAILWVSLMTGAGANTKAPVDSPVFRVPSLSEGTDYNFVDLIGRRYKNWDDYVSNNKLPPSEYYYPKGGKYSKDENGDIEIVLGRTPAAQVGRKVLHATDVLGGVFAVGAGIGFLFPPTLIAAGITAGAVSVYGIVRSSVRLADRGNHNQSIKDKEAIREWFSLVACTLGLGSTGALVACRLLAAEVAISEVASNLMGGLRCVTGIVNGIGAMDHALVMFRQNRPLDPLQSFQMAANLMLVVACAGSEAMVRTVVKIAQVKVLPLIVQQTKIILQKITSYVDLKQLLKTLDQISKKFPYGPEFMRAVHILIDAYNCKNIPDAMGLLPSFMDLLNRLFIHRKDCLSDVKTEKEIMSDILNDDNFIPQLLYFLESKEKIFHFPSDHCNWGQDGELSNEDYVLMGRNFLDLPSDINPDAHVWKDSGASANVYFEHYGLVNIRSCVDQQIIMLKHTKKTTESIL